MSEHFEKMACSVPAPLGVVCANNSCRQFREEKVETRHGPQASSAVEELVGESSSWLLLHGIRFGLVANESEPVSSGEE